MKKHAKYLLAGGLGGLIGIFVTGVVMYVFMPAMMVSTYETVYGYDETINRLKDRIEDAGWVVSGVTRMNDSLAKQGIELEPRVTLVSLCHPDYAESVLKSDRYVSVMMPCKFSVWEDDAGRVHLTKMNMGLMGTLFGGNIATIMGQHVAVDEANILDGLLKH